MSIYLNGNKVPGHNLHVSASLQLAGEDLSGNSSSTAQAEKGDKPKTISVRTTIKFKNKAELAQIYAMAEARDTATERQIYSIINDTAEALKIRQVRFQGNVETMEQYNQRQWDVSFQLVEYRSVPEKKQERTKAKPVTTQRAAGNTVASPSSSATAPAATEAVVLTEFEQTLKGINDMLKK